MTSLIGHSLGRYHILEHVSTLRRGSGHASASPFGMLREGWMGLILLARVRPRLPLDFFNQKEKIGMGKTQIGSRNTMMFDVWRYVLVVWMCAGKPWVIWVWK